MSSQFGRFVKLGLTTFLVLVITSTVSWAQGQGRVRRIVVFQEGFTSHAAQRALVARSGGEVIKPLPIVNGMAIVLPLSAEKGLRGRGEVVRVENDAVVHALKPAGKPDKGKGGKKPPAQPDQVLEWGVDRIDAEWAWPTSTGAGVKVAVLDTGIDHKHPDLDGNCKGGYNAINPRKDYKDDNGHGTHVAGIIAAEDNEIGVVGVAPEAWLYGVKVLNRSGGGWTSDIIDGITWCINNEMDIINMSLGTSSDIQSLHDACDAADTAGLLLVGAAGNEAAPVIFPAAYGSVIAVAATDISDARPYWSNHGPEIDLAAPGVEIFSTWKGGGYQTHSGTSMASPHVAGTLALNLEADIFGTADDLPPTGWDQFTGDGLVDAGEAATGIPDYGNDLDLP